MSRFERFTTSRLNANITSGDPLLPDIQSPSEKAAGQSLGDETMEVVQISRGEYNGFRNVVLVERKTVPRPPKKIPP